MPGSFGHFSKIIGFDAKLGKMVNFRRNNAFSFAATWPFAVTGWNPDVNGTVNSVAVGGSRCSAVYLGGAFTQVHGQPARNIAAVSASTGVLDPSFAHSANRAVETVLLVGCRLLVGGHERWADNRHGCNRPGPGSIRAPGMGGFSPSGALTFDPTRSRGGGGADDMLMTRAGLWIASDNFRDSQGCGHRPGFAGICFLRG